METSKFVTPDSSFSAVMQLIAALRGENGCPWDRDQTPSSLVVYLIEETYELVEAVIADDSDAISEEMGDVLFQVLFLLSIYQQDGRLILADVLAKNMEKMIRRHPHVFGPDNMDTASQVKKRWREIKQQEKSGKQKSIMDSVPAGMPGLMRSYRISERAAGVGFDWDNLEDVIDQVEAEWEEFKAELHFDDPDSVIDREKAAMEFGDVLFSMVNAARIAGLHPETALGRSIEKFIRRFKQMEAMAIDRSVLLKDMPREELESLWHNAKQISEQKIKKGG